MHLFDCHQVFHELYEADCSRASAEFRPKFKGSIPPAEIFQALGPSVDWHRKQLSRYKDLMKSIRLRETCLSCIRRRPQYGFPCGHLICRNCVRVFYPPSDSDPWQYRLETCHICSEPTPGLSVYLTPDTSQLRVLSVDGGGIRGSAPIGFLKSIQDEIGIPGYKVQRNFDVKIGTSSGALSVISLDVLGWSVDDCMSHLKRFAKESFVQRCPDFLLRLCRLPFVSSVVWLLQLVYALLADSKYDVNGLERLLQDTYGSDRCITDLSTATVMGTYVGVTLTKARDDYRHLESDDGQKLVKWWEVLRCATAAPL
ncbi:hypothetical protein BHE90_009552 [Fusarium euwallaceae]|uniref:PNPLA domain-containing protein n=2 Tax=Fusarium solani species complex TaxID=232080 RepID=A0A430LJS2_9HYPO|nr:hypothetical protein CDV31_013703 [Fusarium ambrosium]RTE75972.1 hypothetical protein BHE90_009552 [Fusarium euwallaceae]